jgi:hypothetical protein
MQPNVEICSIEELEIDQFVAVISQAMVAEITLLNESVAKLSFSTTSPFYQQLFQILKKLKNSSLHTLLYFKPPDKILGHYYISYAV